MAFSLSVARALEEFGDDARARSAAPHRHESTTVLRTLATRVHESFCRLGGHDYLLHVADNRIFLQCSTCSHETPGWLIDIVHGRSPPPCPEGTAPTQMSLALASTAGARRAFRITTIGERSAAPDNEDRARRRTNDVMRGRAEHEQIQCSSPVDAHHNQVRATLHGLTEYSR